MLKDVFVEKTNSLSPKAKVSSLNITILPAWTNPLSSTPPKVSKEYWVKT
jgi:hypothetical protein